MPRGMSTTPSSPRIALISRAAWVNRPAFGETAPRRPTRPAAEVHALLEVHLHVAGRLEGAVPRVSRVDGVRRHTARLGGSLLPGHCDSPEQAFSGRPLL